MTPVKRNSWSDVVLSNVWNNFFGGDLFDWDNNFASTGNNIPAVNIKETQESFRVEITAPEMDKKDFKIELDGTALTISAERKNEGQGKDGENYNRKEFSYQSFYRSFHVPKEVVNAEKIEAKYENGLLKLNIPKKEEAKKGPPRLITIK